MVVNPIINTQVLQWITARVMLAALEPSKSMENSKTWKELWKEEKPLMEFLQVNIIVIITISSSHKNYYYRIINFIGWLANHFQQDVFQSVPATHALMAEYVWSTIRGTGAIVRTPRSGDGTVEEASGTNL